MQKSILEKDCVCTHTQPYICWGIYSTTCNSCVSQAIYMDSSCVSQVVYMDSSHFFMTYFGRYGMEDKEQSELII